MPTRQCGFTLLERIGVGQRQAHARRGQAYDGQHDQQLERDAQRLAALLESARSHARASAAPVEWRTSARGFEFIGANRPATGEEALAPRDWLSEGVQAFVERPVGAATLRLGPEPLIPAQTLRLNLDGRELRLVTDGFEPFRIQPDQPGAP